MTGNPGRLQVETLFPVHCTGIWVSAIPWNLTATMQGPGLDARMWAPSSDPLAQSPFLRDTVPKLLSRILYRVQLSKSVFALSERRYLAAIGPEAIAYLYPGNSLRLMRQIKSRGQRLLLERINCQESASKPILDAAYQSLGQPGCPDMNEAQVRESRETVLLADRIFSPSALVTQSLLADGVPRERIFDSSYGWDPALYAGDHRSLPPEPGLTVLFVGTVCVRKGAHLLLEAWARSGVRGRLVLAGLVEPLIADRCKALLSRPDVLSLGYADDIGAVYRSADVFAFPSLEEGSPLVSYEAMGHGLASVLSPMGAGTVARHGTEALVLDPHDVEAWSEAFRTLAEDAALRRRLGDQARLRAQEFTWEKVGARRRSQILDWIKGA
jgi:glycosyltransferase involved in cell wall biosynthesis